MQFVNQNSHTLPLKYVEISLDSSYCGD